MEKLGLAIYFDRFYPSVNFLKSAVCTINPQQYHAVPCTLSSAYSKINFLYRAAANLFPTKRKVIENNLKDVLGDVQIKCSQYTFQNYKDPIDLSIYSVLLENFLYDCYYNYKFFINFLFYDGNHIEFFSSQDGIPYIPQDFNYIYQSPTDYTFTKNYELKELSRFYSIK